MTNETTLFDNKFVSVNIRPQRFYNFCYTSKTRFTLGNSTGIFTPLLNILNPALAAFGDELNIIDTGLNQQKGSTVDTSKILQNFRAVMSDYERLIAKKLGGKTSAAYQEFYPHKLSEYTLVTKVQMPVLTNRVYDATQLFAAELGAELVSELELFKGLWDVAHSEQTQNKGKVATGRSKRSAKRLTLEGVMMKAIGAVLVNFGEDAEKCKSFFDFSLLYPDKHQYTFHVHVPKYSIGNLEHTLKANGSIEVTAVGADISLYYSDEEDMLQGNKQIAENKVKTNLQNNNFGDDLAARKYIVIDNQNNDNDVVVTIVFKRKTKKK